MKKTKMLIFIHWLILIYFIFKQQIIVDDIHEKIGRGRWRPWGGWNNIEL